MGNAGCQWFNVAFRYVMYDSPAEQSIKICAVGRSGGGATGRLTKTNVMGRGAVQILPQFRAQAKTPSLDQNFGQLPNMT
jgi:hypothetical protein